VVAAKKLTALKIKENEGMPPALSLTPQERRFALAYFDGDVAGNGTRSYLAIHPECSYDAASVEASTLLKQPNVRAFLEQLHQAATALTVENLRPWSELLPLAQSVIVSTAQGRLRNRLAYEAAREICNRVMGTPVSVASTELIVRDEAKIAKAVTAFSRRMATENRKRVREVVAD
jgi:hypothetical protein